MKEILALATGKSYDLVANNMVTAHPAQRPYPTKDAFYLSPIKKGGCIEIVYEVVKIIECLPKDIYNYRDSLEIEHYNNLVSYHENRLKTFGYGKKDTNYRFYILKPYAHVKQPFYKKNIQLSVKFAIDDDYLIKI